MSAQDTACVGVSYSQASEVVDLAISLNGKKVFDDTVPLKQLSKECVGIPYIKKEAQVCADFNNISISTTEVGACAAIEIDVFREKVLAVDLGCFHFDLLRRGAVVEEEPAAAADCDSITTKDTCDSSGCSWCLAGAVPPSCKTKAEAGALPPSVFQCDGI